MAAGFIGGEAQDQAGELDGPLSCAAPQLPLARVDDPADRKRPGTGWADRRPAGGQELHHRSRFDSIAALSPDAIICANDRNLITSWNRAAEQIFGYTEAEIVGASLSLIVPVAFRRMHENGLFRVAAGSTPTLVGKIMAVQALRRDGTEFPIELSLTAWQENGRRHFGAIIRDITERRAAEETLRREADFDFLTGVANRRLLSDRLREASGAGKPSALILFDLDGFKDVNDSLGHAAGDEILRVVAQRLQASAGENTLVARMGGDEFAVFAWGQRQAAKIEDLAQRLVAEIEKMILFESRCIYV